MKNQLDLKQSSVYDIVINANKTLDVSIQAYFMSGTTQQPFSFDDYTSAELIVKKTKNSDPVLTFSTVDASIELMADKFRLHKAAADLNVREGEYIYEMVLYGMTIPVRAFLEGKFIINTF